jgi:AcrR family transcriptional regulator
MTDGNADGRRARGVASRTAIIQATARVLGRDGLDAVTHRAVAAEAGVSVARTTYHFATLNALLTATHVAVANENIERLRAATALAAGGQLSLVDACSAYLVEQLGPGVGDFRAVLEFQVAAARQPSLRPAAATANAGFIELIKVFVPDQVRAEAVFAAVIGFAMLAATQSDGAAPAEIHDFLECLFEHYAAPDPRGDNK